MPNKERMLTLHPTGKKGVNIELAKYEQVRALILAIIKKEGRISFQTLSALAAEALLKAGFEGKPLWYIVTVKLDLEARKVIERIPKTSP